MKETIKLKTIRMGNELGVVIPKSVSQEANLKEDEVVELVLPENDRIDISKLDTKEKKLAWMDKVLANSELTEEDVERIGHKIKEGIARRHGLIK